VTGMLDHRRLRISVVIPLYNGETTILKTLKSLFNQNTQFDELIVVNDASTDRSLALVEAFLSERPVSHKIINHSKSRGLSASYNDGIKICSGDLVVTLHGDVVLRKHALERLVGPFWNNDNVVASYHCVDHPRNVWKKYNFWQKCFFSRLVEKRFCGLDGKFDCFRKSALEKVGMFDGKTFFRAGEDGDIVHKLRKKGKIVKTKAGIIHIHTLDPNFSFKSIVYKQAQYSASQGALFRRYGFAGVREFVSLFFRELLVISLLFPHIRTISIFLIIIYSFLYTKSVYLSDYKNPRILILPFLNIYLLFVSFVYSIRGFMYGKQTI